MPRKPREKRVRAQVGWTGSTADQSRLFDVMKWLMDNRGDEVRSDNATTINRNFNLCYEGLPTATEGADFLADEGQYDTVILHFILAGFNDADGGEERTQQAIAPFDDPICQLAFARSEKQLARGAQAWHERLIASNARRIFAFGSSWEVAASYLGQIPGYRRYYEPWGAVYEREDISAQYEEGAA